MASEHWFRWHHGTVTDPKWRVVAARASKAMSRNVTVGHVVSIWAAMMENASQANPRGFLVNWSDEDMATALGYDELEVSLIRESMQGKTLDGDELTGWNRRQIKAEDAKAVDRKRAQRLRESLKNVTESHDMSQDVTACHDRGEERRGEEKDQEHVVSPKTTVPYQEIVDAYHDSLPMLARVQSITDKRKGMMRRAWQALPSKHRDPVAFRAIFIECATDSFLNGTGPYSGDHANWRPSFDFLIRADKLIQVYEKAMDRRARLNGGKS